jgi:hypothetical protein
MRQSNVRLTDIHVPINIQRIDAIYICGQYSYSSFDDDDDDDDDDD